MNGITHSIIDITKEMMSRFWDLWYVARAPRPYLERNLFIVILNTFPYYSNLLRLGAKQLSS